MFLKPHANPRPRRWREASGGTDRNTENPAFPASGDSPQPAWSAQASMTSGRLTTDGIRPPQAPMSPSW